MAKPIFTMTITDKPAEAPKSKDKYVTCNLSSLARRLERCKSGVYKTLTRRRLKTVSRFHLLAQAMDLSMDVLYDLILKRKIRFSPTKSLKSDHNNYLHQ